MTSWIHPFLSPCLFPPGSGGIYLVADSAELYCLSFSGNPVSNRSLYHEWPALAPPPKRRLCGSNVCFTHDCAMTAWGRFFSFSGFLYKPLLKFRVCADTCRTMSANHHAPGLACTGKIGHLRSFPVQRKPRLCGVPDRQLSANS